MNKTLKIWIIVISVIAFCGALFCTIWYTVPVDVNSKIEKFLDKANEFTFFRRGRTYSISRSELEEILVNELKDVKYKNSSNVSKIGILGESLSIRYDNKKGLNYPRILNFDSQKVTIGFMVYISDKEDLESIILEKVMKKAVNITPPPPPGYEDALG